MTTTGSSTANPTSTASPAPAAAATDSLVVPAPEGADLAVRVRGLRKTYGETHAVDGADLDVVRGEVLALLGPNGAGKTTTTEILEGYRHRDGGEVDVLGVDPAHGDARWRSRIGIVLQTASDLGVLTLSLIHISEPTRPY